MKTTGPVEPSAEQQTELVAGRYRLESLLARGGVGAVYKAWDISSGQALALKQLLPEAARHRRLSLLFQREYHTLALLQHPRVIEVYDYGVTASGPYYTMELLDGMDLGELSPIPYRKACHYLRDVASSLALLHSRRLLHRDLSPRNVRCTSDDRCKLLDFGTMATFGTSSEIVGTPPLVPPEALRGMPLDHRADIYSLGALAYRTLTRRHAYRARQLEDLPELFRSAPPPPSSLVASIPADLDELVLAMLSLDPLLRPPHISEVIDRLTAIGDLPEADDVGDTARSYLLSTRLVGRRRPMEQLKSHLKEAADGRGAGMMVEGNPGVGKTRLLDEASLHAQLMGFLVLRVEARSHRGAYAVLSALARGLMHAAPRDAEETGQGLGPVLSAFLNVSDPRASPEPPRALLQDAMVAWFCLISERLPLAVLVDDLHRVDEPSAAFLLALTRRLSRHAILLVTSRRLAGRMDAPQIVPTLAAQARRIRLHRLKPRGTSVLVRGLFGEVPNVEAAARYIHEVTTGSPEQIMALCEYLVEHKIVRYADGMWVLPTEIALSELPESLADTMQARISALGARARMLAEAASVRRGPIPLELLAAAVPDFSKQELFAEVDALVKAGIMISSGDGYAFGQDALRESLRGSMNDTRRRQCHRLLANALLAQPETNLEDRIEAGYHTLRGGNDVAGAKLLAETAAELGARGDTLDAALVAFEAALGVLEREHANPNDIIRLRTTLVMSANREVCERYGSSTLALLATYAGVPLMNKVRVVGASAALALGLGAAVGRRFLQKEDQRGPRPQVALTLLFRAIFVLLPVRSSAMDIRGLRELSEYAHLLKKTPVIGPVSAALVDGVLATAQGQYRLAEDALSHAIELLRRDSASRVLQTESIRGMLAAAYIAQGMLRVQVAVRGADALDVVDALRELTSDPRFSGLNQGIGPDGGLTTTELLRATHQVRVAYHLGRGETELAAIHSEQLAAEGLRAGLYWQFDTFRTLFELRAGHLCGDLSGLRRGREQLRQFDNEVLTLTHESRAAEVAIALALGRRLEARQLSDTLTADLLEGQHAGWDTALLQRAELLRTDGDLQGASDTLVRLIKAGTRLGRKDQLPFLLGEIELARVEAAMGDLQHAMARIDTFFGLAQAIDHPLLLARAHSCAAYVAIAAGEQSHCEAHVRHAQHWASLTRNTALLTQTHRLEAEYRRAFGVTETKRTQAPDSHFASRASKVQAEVEALMADCEADPDRARRALYLILEATAATAGHLYLTRDSDLSLSHAAAVGLGESQDPLEQVLQSHVLAASHQSRSTPPGDPDVPAIPVTLMWNDEEDAGEAYQVFLLFRRTGNRHQVAAVVAVPSEGAPLKPVSQGFLDAVGACLRGGTTTAIRT